MICTHRETATPKRRRASLVPRFHCPPLLLWPLWPHQQILNGSHSHEQRSHSLRPPHTTTDKASRPNCMLPEGTALLGSQTKNTKENFHQKNWLYVQARQRITARLLLFKFIRKSATTPHMYYFKFSDLLSLIFSFIIFRFTISWRLIGNRTSILMLL